MSRPARLPLLAPFLIAALAAGCASDEGERRPEPAPAAAKPGAKSGSGGDLDGLFVPARPAGVEELTLWPEAYRGELVLRSVAAQGSEVTAGEVLAEFDARAIDQEVADAEFELRAAQSAHETLVARQELEAESEAATLERARAGLERARRALEGFREHELAFEQRDDELSRAREQNWIEDQEDELEQLQMMYEADELTDATEDLVLKRTRRDLELTRDRNALSESQRSYEADYERARTAAEREEAVAKQALELAQLERKQELEGRSRELARQRSARELEKKREALLRLQRDRERFTLRAPVAGVFLHGDPEDYRPGNVPAPLEAGDKLTPRSPLGHIADPRPDAVALELDLETAAGLEDGAAATVRAAGRKDAAPLRGRVQLAPYPTPGKGGPVYRALIELDEPAEGVRTGMPAKARLGAAK